MRFCNVAKVIIISISLNPTNETVARATPSVDSRPILTKDGWTKYRSFSAYGIDMQTKNTDGNLCQEEIFLDPNKINQNKERFYNLGLITLDDEGTGPLQLMNNISQRKIVSGIRLIFSDTHNANICQFLAAYKISDAGSNTYRVMFHFVFNRLTYDHIDWRKIEPYELPEVALTYEVPPAFSIQHSAFSIMLIRENQGFWK